MNLNNYINYDKIVEKTTPIFDYVNYTPIWKESYKNTDMDGWQHQYMRETNQFYNSVPVEFSEFDKNIVHDYMKKYVPNDGLIVEIGVWRNPNNTNTSTQLFLDNKNEKCSYLGIDIEDRHHIMERNSENVYFLKTDSANTDVIKKYIKDKIGKKINFLFIDGLHSLEQVTKEISLIELVEKGGVIGFHDISVHAGPNLWMDAFNENFFDIFKYRKYNDWGIGIIVKKF